MGFVTKKVTRCTLTVVLALGLGTGAAQARDGDYAILIKTLANPFWGAMGEDVEDGAKAATYRISFRPLRATRQRNPSSMCATPCCSARRLR